MRFGESSAGARSITPWQRVIHQTRPRSVISAQPSIHPTPVDRVPVDKQTYCTNFTGKISLPKSKVVQAIRFRTSAITKYLTIMIIKKLKSCRLSLKRGYQRQVSITGLCIYLSSVIGFISKFYSSNLDVIKLSNYCHRKMCCCGRHRGTRP